MVKLALNILIASTNQGLAEAIVLGEAHGVDRAALLEVVKGSSVVVALRGLQVAGRSSSATIRRRSSSRTSRRTSG